jgi:uncharacterized protein DUF6471
MRTNRDWQALAKGAIRAELARRRLSYKDLSERLAAMGVKQTERNLSNKIGRGTFSAVFFFQCMEAIGLQNIHLNGE